MYQHFQSIEWKKKKSVAIFVFPSPKLSFLACAYLKLDKMQPIRWKVLEIGKKSTYLRAENQFNDYLTRALKLETFVSFAIFTLAKNRHTEIPKTKVTQPLSLTVQMATFSGQMTFSPLTSRNFNLQGIGVCRGQIWYASAIPFLLYCEKYFGRQKGPSFLPSVFNSWSREEKSQ